MRYFAALLIAATLSLGLIFLGAMANHSGWVPETKQLFFHELGEAGKLALALVVASLAIKEVVEAALKETGHGLKTTIASTFGDTGTKVEHGFTDLTMVVREALLQMKVNVQLVRDEPSPQESDAEVAKGVPPLTAALAREGKASEAIAKIETGSSDPIAKAQQEIAVLLLSTKESDWELAAQRLEQGRVQRPDIFLRLSFKFWDAGKLDRAIQVAEKGLAIAGKIANGEAVGLDLKSNLAYFYADANRTDKKAEAIQYITEARKQRPLNAELLETEGCVKIAFGTEEEAIEGIRECMEAAKAKHDATTLRRWLRRYDQRTF
jgi:hypothetical protein